MRNRQSRLKRSGAVAPQSIGCGRTFERDVGTSTRATEVPSNRVDNGDLDAPVGDSGVAGLAGGADLTAQWHAWSRAQRSFRQLGHDLPQWQQSSEPQEVDSGPAAWPCDVGAVAARLQREQAAAWVGLQQPVLDSTARAPRSPQ
jgi:hypothetical protein